MYWVSVKRPAITGRLCHDAGLGQQKLKLKKQNRGVHEVIGTQKGAPKITKQGRGRKKRETRCRSSYRETDLSRTYSLRQGGHICLSSRAKFRV
jgi:hypothetical protein